MGTLDRIDELELISLRSGRDDLSNLKLRLRKEHNVRIL